MNPTESCLLAVKNPSSVFWVKDAGYILVVDEQRQMAYRLIGDEAAVWGWFQLSYPCSKITQMLSAMQGSSFDNAEQRLAEIIQTWVQAGLLQPV